MFENTTGNYNTALGHAALNKNTTASNSTAVGYQAAYSNTEQVVTAFGFKAGFAQSGGTPGSNTWIGYQAGISATTGGANTAVGRDGLASTTTGAYNTAVGAEALENNTTASYSTAVGYRALYSNSTTTGNTAIGYQALLNNTGSSRQVAVGYRAMENATTAQESVAVGYDALQQVTSGQNNTAIGYNSLDALTTNSNNTAVGASAGTAATGASNTFIGASAGSAITTGADNTIIGRYTGNQGGLDIRTSSNNIVLSDGDGNPRAWYDGSGQGWVFGAAAGGYNSNNANVGISATVGFLYATRDGNIAARFGRDTNDGTIVEFRQDGNTEGTISVSGSTVSYNGGHLARWSQTADNTRIDLLKGTVMTNLDQMAVWGDEDNEQLNCMAVSSVEGDPNVAGVFVNWDNDDETYTADMNIAMTGDMIIRIAQGTTVQRGDLLMSAGDGTAKPQGDDIVRSKTIAKVTSTHVTCTYDDGSYCVPCVLMAC